MIRNYTAYDHREICGPVPPIIIIWRALIGEKDRLQVVAAWWQHAALSRWPNLRFLLLTRSSSSPWSTSIPGAYMRHPKRGPKSPLQTMRDVTIATFCSSRHQDPGQGVLWKFWKCTKVKQENKGGAPSVLKCNNPADLEALNSLILKKVSSRVYWSKYHFNLNNSQVISLKSVPNVYTEQMKLNQRSLSSDVTI